MSKDLKKWVQGQIESSSWAPLLPALEKNLLYLLDEDMDLDEVALALQQGKEDFIKECLDQGVLTPPTEQEAEDFLNIEGEGFKVVLVDPYFVAQRKLVV